MLKITPFEQMVFLSRILGNAEMADPEMYVPYYYVSAFTTPLLPVISTEDIKKIKFYRWGLIPHWVKDKKDAETIRLKTLNARAETIHEKPSYTYSIKSKRCLIPINGFFEWQEVNGKKYPYFIKMTDNTIFSLAGIWDVWENKETGEIIISFSVITTPANPLLSKIHNTKQRMPVILKQESENIWLNQTLDNTTINSLLKPYDEDNLEAYTISRLISQKNVNKNIPEAIKKFDYGLKN